MLPLPPVEGAPLLVLDPPVVFDERWLVSWMVTWSGLSSTRVFGAVGGATTVGRSSLTMHPTRVAAIAAAIKVLNVIALRAFDAISARKVRGPRRAMFLAAILTWW